MDDQQLSELIEGSVQDLNFMLGIQTDKKWILFFLICITKVVNRSDENWSIMYIVIYFKIHSYRKIMKKKIIKKDFENHILVALLKTLVGEEKKIRCIFD